MSGLLHNLSALALGRSAGVRSVARLPHAGLPPVPEMPATEQMGTPPAPAAPIAALPPMADRTAPSQAGIAQGIPPALLPYRHHDASDTPLEDRTSREPADREIGMPAMHPRTDSAAPTPVTTPPALVPTTPHVPAPVFVMPPLTAAAGPARGRQPVGGGETTDVHVSIGRIELTAVQEAPPPVRRAAPAKPSLSLHDYLGRRQRSPS